MLCESASERIEFRSQRRHLHQPIRPQGPTACQGPTWPGQAAAHVAQSLLEVDNVSKSYGGVRPAQDVSFRLQPGHIHALIGPNGAGKSTMINMLSGVVTPDAGRIRLLGTDIQ